MPAPTLRFMLSHPAHILSLGLGSGLAPKAPGTFGSFAAWASFLLLKPQLSDLSFGIFLLVCLLAGSVMVAHTCRALGTMDHGAVVWDEFVAVWLVLWLLPATWAWQLAGVLVFRFFDIVKPWPIRVLDARFKSGFGVMLDDLVAALFTLMVMACAWRVLA
ncbi:MAG: phosphatidylglycerophosphatase A [Moraxellaceae bacterium]|nr:phosphatidylglycerophosphatase A [Moraxellaceae bacterium]